MAFRGNSPTLLTPEQIRANLAQMPVWNQRTQLPDPVNFVDWLGDQGFVCDLWANEAAGPEPIARFHYPKSGGGERLLTVVSARDHVRLRVAAGRIIPTTDPLLAKTVHSSRLGKRPPAWRFKTKHYSEFRRRASQDARRWACDGMVRTDARDYYLCIPMERLVEAVFETGADPVAAAFLFTQILSWNDRDRLPGLPVGPDAAGVLGSFYLRPVDQLMASSFESWHRNTHDIVYFFRNDRIQNSGLRLLADGFAALGLQIALDKTKPADNCLDALALIRRAALDYLTEGLRTGPPGETGDVRLYFDERRAAEEFDFIDQSSVLGVLAREGDPHAVRAVATEPELFRRNPVGCADYLLTTAQSDGDCVDAVTETALDPGAPPAVWTRST